MHVQCMLKMSRVCHSPIGILGRVWCLIVSIPDLCTLTYFYTLAEILSKIFVKKTKENRGPYLRSWFDKLTICCQLNFIKIYNAITACTTYTVTFGKW